MAASEDAVQAAQSVLGCFCAAFELGSYCTEHGVWGTRERWTERGCPTAVAVADAVATVMVHAIAEEELRWHNRALEALVEAIAAADTGTSPDRAREMFHELRPKSYYDTNDKGKES